MLSYHQLQIVIDAAKQVPGAWQQRFASNVMDELFGQADLTDEDVVLACKSVGHRMEVNLTV